MLDCRRDITTALIYVFIYLGQLGKRGGTDLKNQWRSKCILHSNKGIYKKNYARTVIQYFWEGFRRNQHNKRCNYQVSFVLFYLGLKYPSLPVLATRKTENDPSRCRTLSRLPWDQKFCILHVFYFPEGKGVSSALRPVQTTGHRKTSSNIVLQNNVGLCFTGWPNMFYKTL